MLIVEHIEIGNYVLVPYIRATECDRLVEYSQGVTHCPVGFLGYDMERLIVNLHFLLFSDTAEIPHDVVHSDPVEVIGLAPGQDSGQYLVLLSRGQNKNSMGRRFLQRLEKGIEGRLGQHMDLIYDIYAVFSHLRRYPDLLHQGLYVIDSIV